MLGRLEPRSTCSPSILQKKMNFEFQFLKSKSNFHSPRFSSSSSSLFLILLSHLFPSFLLTSLQSYPSSFLLPYPLSPSLLLPPSFSPLFSLIALLPSSLSSLSSFLSTKEQMRPWWFGSRASYSNRRLRRLLDKYRHPVTQKDKLWSCRRHRIWSNCSSVRHRCIASKK